jgi:hypothetical protein
MGNLKANRASTAEPKMFTKQKLVTPHSAGVPLAMAASLSTCVRRPTLAEHKAVAARRNFDTDKGRLRL